MLSGENNRDGRCEPVDNRREISRIYSQYQAELKGFIARRVTLKEDVEDILQNVFYALARIDLVENPIEQISAWLYSVTRNQIIDRSRKKKEERMAAVADDPEEDDCRFSVTELLTDPADTPEMAYLQSLVWTELELALSELPEEQRTVFELTELEDFSFREISESTGIPVNTLLSRKRYAVLHLRRRLKDLYEDMIGD
jgi:RNA polymerase sigma factor (sigma-70 family)